MKYYSQVLLKNENRIMVTWIPTGLATVGKVLKLKDKDIWENGWVVTDIYSTKSFENLELLTLVLKDFKSALGE